MKNADEVKIMIMAGEASGDLHGGKLVRALKQKRPDAQIFGIGGDEMKAAGMEVYFHVNDLAYVGFTEVMKHFLFFRRVFNAMLAKLKENKPDVLVLIDYPGFNLRFARAAKKSGAKIFYYIAPQVWAWGQARARKMAKFIDKMAVIFEFEVDFFSKFGIETHFVGHPLLEGFQINRTKEEFHSQYNLKKDRPILALLPGSRVQEVKSLLPVMLESGQILKEKYPELQIAISKASTISKELLCSFIPPESSVSIIENSTYELLKCARAAVVASGTATLETAFFQVPFAIVYRISPISFVVGKRLVKIPFIGLINVVAGERIIKEFLQEEANSENLVPEMARLLYDEQDRSNIIKNLEQVKNSFGKPEASNKTAELIVNLADKS